MKQGIVIAALSGSLLFLTTALSGALGQDDLEVKVGPTVEITRSHSWCWFPTAHKFRSGEIIVTEVLSPDQVNGESATSAYCISRDGGLTWGRRYTMGQGANQDGAWSEVPDQDDMFWQVGSYPEPERDGDTQHFYATLTKFGRGGRYSCEDRDVSLAFREPVHFSHSWLFDYYFDGKSPVSDTRILIQFGCRAWGNIVKGSDGAYYCTAYLDTVSDAVRAEEAGHQVTDSRRSLTFDRIVLLRSTDGGKSWAERGVIAQVPAGDRPSWVGAEGFNEGSLSVLADGRLYAVYRTTNGSGGMIGNGWSSDGGRTWTEPASIGFNGVAPRIHRLSNGMLALSTGRPGPVVLRFNFDGNGVKWGHPVTIYSEMSSRYTDLVEVAPGRLLVVYDHLPYGWYEIPFPDRDARNIIYGTFVNIVKN